MGAIPDWYRLFNAAPRLNCSVMDLARDPELLYWLPHAEAAIEAEAGAREARENSGFFNKARR